MRYFLRGLVLILITAVSVAQSKDFQLIYKDGKVGLSDASGNVIIPAEYEKLGWSTGNEDPQANTIGYKKGELWGLLALDNQRITEAEYTSLYPAKGGFYVASVRGKVSQNDFLGVITNQGKTIIPFKYNAIKVADLRAVVGVKYGRQYKFGVVDMADKSIIPIEYKEIVSLGHLRFAVKNFDNKTAIFSDNGKPVVDFVLDSISSYQNGNAIIYANHKLGVVNNNGQIVEEPQFQDVRLEDELQVKAFDEWQVLRTGKTSLSINYDNVIPFGDQNYKVEANGKSWVINKENEPLTPQRFSYIEEPVNGKMLFRYHNKWGVIDAAGEIFMKPKYDSLILNNDVIYAKSQGSWSLFDFHGVQKSNTNYDEIGRRTGYYYPVKKKNHWGFIDRSGEEVIHCVYDQVGEIINNMVVVRFHGEYGILDKNGDWVVLPQKGRLTIINDDYYLIKSGKLSTLKSYDDETIYFTENKVDIMEDHLLEHLSDGGLWKIDFNGRIVNRDIPQQRFEEIRSSGDGLFAVKYQGRFGFVDNQNRLIIANRYEDVGDFGDGLIAVKLLGKWGYIDRYENIIIQPVYTEVSLFKNNMAIVKAPSGYGIIDKEGQKLTPQNFDKITALPSGRFLVKKQGKYGLLDTEGSFLINAKYDMLEEVNDRYTKVSLFGKFGVLTSNGVDVIPIMYDDLFYDARFDEYLVKKKSSWVKVAQ